MGGSFVRPKKVDFGISIFEALKQRYGQGGDSINEEDMYVMSGNNRWKAVEMVGADSIQQKQRYSRYWTGLNWYYVMPVILSVA